MIEELWSLQSVGRCKVDLRSFRAKLLATNEGVELALELGLRSIILEVDASLVIESLESSLIDYLYNGCLIHEICVLGLRCERFKAQHISR